MKVNRDQMAEHVRQWRASGLSRKAYARRYGVTYSCLCYYARRLGQEACDQGTGFVAVTGAAEAQVRRSFGSASAPGVCLRLDGRLEVRLPIDCEATFIGKLCRELLQC